MFENRLRTALAIAALATGGTLAIGAAEAGAYASGCTPAPDGASCGEINGSGLHIDNVDASRLKQGTEGISSFSAIMDVVGPDGRNLLHLDSGIVRNGQTQFGRAYVTFPVNRDFPAGSRVCTHWFEFGRQQGGSPCNTLHP